MLEEPLWWKVLVWLVLQLFYARLNQGELSGEVVLAANFTALQMNMTSC